MIRQCCECKKIWIEGEWVEPVTGQLENQDITHGYCEECFVKQMQIIHNFSKLTKPPVYKRFHPFYF